MATIKTLLGYVKGPKGDTGETGGTGPAGAAATVDAGMVNNVAYGQPARVTNVGTPHAAVFNFDIPEGRPGSIGEISGYPVNAITTQAGDFPIPNVGDTIAAIVGKQAKATADAKSGIQTAMSNASDALDAATAASASIANILGDFATIEPTATASKEYEIGERIVLNGLYYKVTAAISQGNALVVDGNIEKTTVGDDITALNKDLANKPYYPDYSDSINITPNTTYTCPSDGFILPVRIFVETAGGENLTINGAVVYGFSAGVEFGGSPFPVKQGDVVRTNRLYTNSRIRFLANRQ